MSVRAVYAKRRRGVGRVQKEGSWNGNSRGEGSRDAGIGARAPWTQIGGCRECVDAGTWKGGRVRVKSQSGDRGDGLRVCGDVRTCFRWASSERAVTSAHTPSVSAALAAAAAAACACAWAAEWLR